MEKEGNQVKTPAFRLVTPAQLIRTIAQVMTEVEAGANIVVMRRGTPVAAITNLEAAGLGREISNLFIGISNKENAPCHE